MAAQGLISETYDKAAQGMDLQQYKYPKLNIHTHSVEDKQQITAFGRQIHPCNSDQ